MVKLLLTTVLGLFAFNVTDRIPFVGPNTEILVISEACAPCVEAVEIISKLQDEGYNVVIINKRGTPPERALARMYKIRVTPTLVVRERDESPEKIVGLKTEAKYRELISQ